jgi:uncharacterized protein
MNEADHYPYGVPCWVDTWQPAPDAAQAFYGPLFGWEFADVPLADGSAYLNASLGGRLVGGIGPGPAGSPAVWVLYIRVENAERAIEDLTRVGGRQLIEPVELGDEGRMAMLADSGGVVFGVWEAGNRTGVQIAGAPNSWAMSALHTPDLGKAEQFYRDGFGWELVRHADTGLCEWRLRGRMIAVAMPTDGVSVPAHWAINFTVTDVDAFAERAQSLGATLLIAPLDSPGFRNAVIADPQGGVIAISAVRH